MSQLQGWPWPRVLAHRGAGILAPENTLAALRIGYEHGFRAVEFDAMAPLDDVPVLMHDETLARTTTGHGAVTAHRAAELARLDAGRWHSPVFAGEPVPTLEAALQFCRAHAIWPNVEIKPAAGHEVRTGELVARAVARAYADVLSRNARLPLLSSFSIDALVAARGAAPGLPRALLVDVVPDDWQQLLQRCGAVSLNTNHRGMSRSGVQRVKDAGCFLFCYTVNEPARARELLDWGVDAFCTDRLDRIGADFAD